VAAAVIIPMVITAVGLVANVSSWNDTYTWDEPDPIAWTDPSFEVVGPDGPAGPGVDPIDFLSGTSYTDDALAFTFDLPDGLDLAYESSGGDGDRYLDFTNNDAHIIVTARPWPHVDATEVWLDGEEYILDHLNPVEFQARTDHTILIGGIQELEGFEPQGLVLWGLVGQGYTIQIEATFPPDQLDEARIWAEGLESSFDQGKLSAIAESGAS
jgi:hypothetical protein